MSKISIMAKACAICGRGYLKAASRSHSNISTLRRQRVNLQTRKIDGQRIKICTNCVRTRTKKLK